MIIYKKFIIFILCLFFSNQVLLGYSQTNQNPNEIVLSDDELVLIFSIFIAGVIGIFLYIARHQILRKKLPYDNENFESKKNRDYEKYHSNWTGDEFLDKKTTTEDEKKYRKAIQNSEFPDYYKILGLTKNATEIEIKNKFRALVKEWHPDKNSDPATKEKMIELNTAYEVLSDKERRENYDRFLEKK